MEVCASAVAPSVAPQRPQGAAAPVATAMFAPPGRVRCHRGRAPQHVGALGKALHGQARGLTFPAHRRPSC